MKQTEVEIVSTDKIKQYLRSIGLDGGKLNDAQQSQFNEIATAFKLNPFKREIYASKYGENFSIIVGYEVYIKRAERSGLLSGWSVTTSGELNRLDLKKSNFKAIITIHRKDFNHPFIHEVELVEYLQVKSDGTVTKFWKEKPVTMIKKVAIAQGFRLCFSDELGGMPYTAEELPNIQEPQMQLPEPDDKSEELIHVLGLVDDCNSLDCLKLLWQENTTLHGYTEFKSAVNAKKKLITAALKAEKEKPQEETEEEKKQRIQKEADLFDNENPN